MSTLSTPMAKEVSKKSRGSGLYLLGLTKREMRILRRAIQFAGYPSLSNWLVRQKEAVIRQQEAVHGSLLTAPTPDEQRIITALQKIGTPMTAVHLAEDTHLTEATVLRTLADLIETGIVEQVRQAKITSAARGATNPEYRLDPKYRPFAR
jgi:predicted HTH transcriptional regulator